MIGNNQAAGAEGFTIPLNYETILFKQMNLIHRNSINQIYLVPLFNTTWISKTKTVDLMQLST